MIGERIGNFSIVSQLGAGGMGEVFLAVHEAIGTNVAIKMLQPHVSANKEHVQRFFNEAIATTKIQHAGIGKIFDVGFTPSGRAYLVMEFLDGETLGHRIQRLGRLPLDQIGDIGKQIASVLEAVHKAGITHRDLKPDNIFIVADDELASGQRVKVLDFGIAKLSGHMGITATAAGTMMGTPAYMSPEQWKNSKNVDWRADAYSLGCLAFEMAAGRPPFVAETIGEACAKHLTEEPPRLGVLVSTPAALDALVASMLAKDPDHRPRTMREIANGFAGLSRAAEQSLAMTLPPPTAMHPSASVPIPMMVARTEGPLPSPSVAPAPRPPNTTLGASASAMTATAAPRKSNRKLMLALLAAGGALAAVVTVLALVLTSPASKPELAAGPPAGPDASIGRIEARPEVTPIVTPDAAVTLAEAPPTQATLVKALAADEIEAMVAKHAGAIARCFLRASKGVDGIVTADVKKITVTIAVQPDGRVATASADNPSATLGACLASVAKSWTFRPSPGGTFRFALANPDATTAPNPPVASAVTNDQVTNRFLQAQRLYNEFKAKHGTRYAAELNELMVFLQLDKPAAERLRKVDAFIAKLNEAPATGDGILSLGAKPPCDIYIDGRSTGLKTPQRELKLSAGRHNVTLLNNEHGIKETFVVEIKPGEVTKHVKDFSDRLKSDEPPSTGDCDEVSCVLSNYAGQCCAKYKKGGKPAVKPRTDVPEELDRSMISAGVGAVRGRVIACGERFSATGKVKVSVKVSPNGSVASVAVKETPDPGLGNCVATAMRGAKFAVTQNGGSFAYPFVFGSAPEAPGAEGGS